MTRHASDGALFGQLAALPLQKGVAIPCPRATRLPRKASRTTFQEHGHDDPAVSNGGIMCWARPPHCVQRDRVTPAEVRGQAGLSTNLVVRHLSPRLNTLPLPAPHP